MPPARNELRALHESSQQRHHLRVDVPCRDVAPARDRRGAAGDLARLNGALEQWHQGFRELQHLDLSRLLPGLPAAQAELDTRLGEIEAMLAGTAPVLGASGAIAMARTAVATASSSIPAPRAQ